MGLSVVAKATVVADVNLGRHASRASIAELEKTYLRHGRPR
jgi:hypothetical protein